MDMSEFDAANVFAPKQSKVDLALEILEHDYPDKAEALRTALNDPVYTSTAIARVLNSWGFELSPDSVQKWRRRNQ